MCICVCVYIYIYIYIYTLYTCHVHHISSKVQNHHKCCHLKYQVLSIRKRIAYVQSIAKPELVDSLFALALASPWPPKVSSR